MERQFKEGDSKLLEALIKIQAVMLPITSNHENGFTKNKYLDLPAIQAVSKPILSEHKISMLQLVDIFIDEKGTPMVTVETDLRNAEGEFVSCTGTLGATEMSGANSTQKLGATITYLRRFQAMTVLGISGTDDDDESDFRPRKGDETADETPPAQRQPLEGAKEVAALRGAIKDLAEDKLFTNTERNEIKTKCMNMREKAPLDVLLKDVQETFEERKAK